MISFFWLTRSLLHSALWSNLYSHINHTDNNIVTEARERSNILNSVKLLLTQISDSFDPGVSFIWHIIITFLNCIHDDLLLSKEHGCEREICLHTSLHLRTYYTMFWIFAEQCTWFFFFCLFCVVVAGRRSILLMPSRQIWFPQILTKDAP